MNCALQHDYSNRSDPMAKEIKEQKPDRGEWHAPTLTPITPNVLKALECLHEATRREERDQVIQLVELAIIHLEGPQT